MGHEEVERCGTAVSRLLQSLEALAENRLQGSQRGRVAGRGGVGERRGRTAAAAAAGGDGGGGGGSGGGGGGGSGGGGGGGGSGGGGGAMR
jgi:hypothetical protein